MSDGVSGTAFSADKFICGNLFEPTKSIDIQSQICFNEHNAACEKPCMRMSNAMTEICRDAMLQRAGGWCEPVRRITNGSLPPEQVLQTRKGASSETRLAP